MKKKERKIAIKKQILTLRFISVFLFVFIVTLFFVLTDSSLFQPKVNEETFKYISFNNRNTTDMLQINDIKRMSDDRGKSNKNKKFIEFSATGEKNLDYDVILYPIINAIDYKYIKYSITNQKKLIIMATKNFIIIKQIYTLKKTIDIIIYYMIYFKKKMM